MQVIALCFGVRLGGFSVQPQHEHLTLMEIRTLRLLQCKAPGACPRRTPIASHVSASIVHQLCFRAMVAVLDLQVLPEKEACAAADHLLAGLVPPRLLQCPSLICCLS